MSEYLNEARLALYDSLIKAYIGAVSGNTTGVRIVTLNAAPTSSTTSYTIDGITYGFKVGDEAMYNDSGNKRYYKLDTLSSGVATWREINFVSKVSDIVSISSASLTADVSSTCSITGSVNDGKMLIIVYTNTSGSDKVVTVPTTYATPKGMAIELTVPDGGYCEVNYLNIGGTIYARGL